MTKEEKELLIKDLSGRIPYRHNFWLQVREFDEDAPSSRRMLTKYIDDIDNGWVVECKPYLRPMSSMTEEEKFELKQEHVKDQQLFAEVIVVLNNTEMRGKVIPHFAADWCDKNMFDYRGLIDKGLAIEVTENNNPYKD